jgi:hypothetical protein
MTTVQPNVQHKCSDSTREFEPFLSELEWEFICYPPEEACRDWDAVEICGNRHRKRWLIGYSDMMNCSVEEALYVYHYDPYTKRRRCYPAFTESHACICDRSLINLYYNSELPTLEGLEELRQEVQLIRRSGGYETTLAVVPPNNEAIDSWGPEEVTLPNNGPTDSWGVEEVVPTNSWGILEGAGDQRGRATPTDSWGLEEVTLPNNGPTDSWGEEEVINGTVLRTMTSSGLTDMAQRWGTHYYSRDPRRMLEEYEETGDMSVLDDYTRGMLEEYDEVLIENSLSPAHMNAIEYISLEKMIGIDTPPMYEYPDWVRLPAETEFNCKELNAVCELPLPRYMGRNTYKKQQLR